MDPKQQVGLKAAAEARDGMIVGLGTGSTATWFIRELGRRIREEKLSIVCVSSSLACSLLAKAEGIPLIPPDQADQIDLYVDGADEVSPLKWLIKGRGAAMVGEKLLAEACSRFLVIVDEGKMVNALGAKFPVPVEVMPPAARLTRKGIEALGGQPTLRMAQGGKDGPVVSDNGNLILDVTFGTVVQSPGGQAPDGQSPGGKGPGGPASGGPDWEALDAGLNALPGVVGHGLFLRYAAKSTVLIGSPAGVRVLA